MTTDQIKLIILDLDGTLYDINDVVKTVYQNQVSFLSSKLNKTRQEVETFFAQNDVFPYVTRESKSATELFARIGINIEEWKAYRNTHFDVSAIIKSRAVNENVIRSLATNTKMILLSSNTSFTIEKILTHLCISKVIFCEIICSDLYPSEQCFNKKTAMKYLSSKFNVPFDSMLSIGDRFQTDIRPLLELGGNGILIMSPKSLEKISIDMIGIGLKSCNEYEFFQNGRMM